MTTEAITAESITAEAIVVRLGRAEFGIPINRVREVLRPPPLVRIPFPPPAVCGIIHLRGSVLPVIDLGLRLLGRASAPPGRLVVVSDGGGWALRVDGVLGLVSTSPESLREAPPEADATLPPGAVAGVVIPAPGRLVTLLNLAPVLSLGDAGEEPQ